MKILMSTILLVSFPALADESKPLELPDTSKIDSMKQKSGAKYEMSCTTGDGRLTKQGEKGFDTCMAESARDAGPNNTGGNGTNKGKASTSVEWKLGK